MTKQNKKIERVIQSFTEVVQRDTKCFIGHLNEYTYFDISYIGGTSEGVQSYKIQIWTYENGCVYEQTHKFSNMDEAILYAVSTTTKKKITISKKEYKIAKKIVKEYKKQLTELGKDNWVKKTISS